jgi:DNA-binding transcriptional MerR regulator
VATAAEATLTIDELARRTGMTVRNIRAHQSRGLLPPPEVRGRTGFYGPEHIARIELIRDLQAEGFNLEAIRKLAEQAPGASAEEVLRFTRALREPWEDEEPVVVTLEDLMTQWGGDVDPDDLRRAVKLGLLRHLDAERFEQASPRLAAAGEELRRLGIPIRRQLELIRDVRKHVDGIAEAFAKFFVDEVWRPFAEAGRPEDDLPRVRDAFERMRPLAGSAVAALFNLAMDDAVGRHFGHELERLVKKRRG